MYVELISFGMDELLNMPLINVHIELLIVV